LAVSIHQNSQKCQVVSTTDTRFRAHCSRFESLLRECLDEMKAQIQGISYGESENVHVFDNGKRISSSFTIDTTGVHRLLQKGLSAESQLEIFQYVVFTGTREVPLTTFRKYMSLISMSLT
jgi:hypothetical protein